MLFSSPKMPVEMAEKFKTWIKMLEDENLTSLDTVFSPKIKSLYEKITAQGHNVEAPPVFKSRIGEYIEKGKLANGGYINIPKFENGINVVPKDMLAFLHKDESVLPANLNPYNPNAKVPNSNALYNINVTLNGSNMNPQEVATAIRKEMAVREIMVGKGRVQ